MSSPFQPDALRAYLRRVHGRPVGDVRTALLSPRLGNIALGMVRREVASGATLDCRWADGQADVTVWPLPFPL